MRFIVFAALVATACAMDYVGPSWPRLPLDLILRGEKPVYKNGDKIVGGDEVVPNSIPSQISLQRGSGSSWSQSCGGSVLSESTILNAAHCVTGVNVNTMRIVAGEHSLRTDSGNEQIRSVASYKMHESYNANTFLNDISLIFLTQTLDLTKSEVAPIALPANGSESSGNLYVTGWGTTSSGGSISDVLRGVEVPFVDDTTCDNNYSPRYNIYPSMLCAGKAGVDSCQGDSGGPLYASKGSNEQVGIVSWGIGCAADGYPGVYTQVSYFIDWITANNQL
jgi:trypsin